MRRTKFVVCSPSQNAATSDGKISGNVAWIPGGVNGVMHKADEALDSLGRLARSRKLLMKRIGIASFLVAIAAYVFYWNMPLLEIAHLPDVYARRSGDFSANVTGWMPRFLVRRARFRLNDGPSMAVGQGWPRDRPPDFTIELPLDALRPGENTLAIEVEGWLRPPERLTRTFRYDSAPVPLPLTVDWSQPWLDVQDGEWERVEVEGEVRVRPKPGEEGYDRMLVATGAFRGDRRIETEVTFRHHTIGRFHKGAREYGFGVLSLWGGHPDDWSHRPRRGWSFALSWYWSKPGGVGNEISYRYGEQSPRWQGSYRDFEAAPDTTYSVIVEVRRLKDEQGLGYFEQRTKWWKRGTSEPQHWMTLDDRSAVDLPDGDYAIALLSFNAQVEFGPLKVLPLK